MNASEFGRRFIWDGREGLITLKGGTGVRTDVEQLNLLARIADALESATVALCELEATIRVNGLDVNIISGGK